jgi:hypothetical protein
VSDGTRTRDIQDHNLTAKMQYICMSEAISWQADCNLNGDINPCKLTRNRRLALQ